MSREMIEPWRQYGVKLEKEDNFQFEIGGAA